MNISADKRTTGQKVLVIACGMIAREVLAVRERLGLEHLELTCLPADFHHRPERIAPALDVAIRQARAAGHSNIFVGYADCGTGGDIDKVCATHGVERIAGPHCFAFYQGNAVFEAIGEDDFRSFYMTDFLCRHFEAFFLRPMGLDRHPELVADLFAHYEKVVYLAQTDDAELDTVARDAARRLGLGYERRFTGYGDLAPALKKASVPDLPGS